MSDDMMEEEHQEDSDIAKCDIDPREQCEWYETRKAVVGTREIPWCANPDNAGGNCNHTVCPIVEDVNEDNG